MNFDEIDYSILPKGREAAFVDFVDILNGVYSEQLTSDRRSNSDQHDNYYGSYGPERSYVTSVLAFLDEYEVDSEIIDISDLPNEEFFKQFGKFKSKVEYIRTRFKLRQNRIDTGTIGTVITIASTYKSEIGKLLETARKIVNQEVKDNNKRDKIFAKIASLQSEIDRDQTTVDALFGRMLDLTKAVGASAENLEPLINQIERIKKIIWDFSDKVDFLPKPDRPKMITKEEDGEGSTPLDDEIPF